jgi:hypothetical protein
MNGAGYISGMVNQAFRFDGADDHVVIPHTPVPSLAGSFTLEMWIRPDSLENSPALVEKGNVLGNRIGMQATAAGRLGGYFDGGAYSALSGPGALSAGRFSHVAFVLDDAADEARVYVDGLLAGATRECTLRAGVGGWLLAPAAPIQPGAEVAAQPAPLSRTVVHPFRGSGESAHDLSLEPRAALRHRAVSAVPRRPHRFGKVLRRLQSRPR